MNKTKIIATLGPSSESEEMIENLVKAGINVARLNMSHGTYLEHEKKITKVHNVNERLGTNVAVMLDTKGPEIRLREFKDGKALLIKDKTFTLTTKLVEGTDEIVSVTYSKLPQDVKIGTNILLSDGLVALEVEKIKGKDIICKVLNTGVIKSNKSVNVPGCKLSFPPLNKQDKADIKFGIEHNVDFIALSFVRNEKDILAVKEYINSLKVKEEYKEVKLIAKIENQEGIENFDNILSKVDGIMIARGDMGVEVPLNMVPIYQKEMIKKCIMQGKISITATQMLESMVINPRPTRAEVSDVANAIYDMTSAIMLSAETASGEYPVECVKMMKDIALVTENDINYWENFKDIILNNYDELNKKSICKKNMEEFRKNINFSVCTSAMLTKAEAILSISHKGKTPFVLSSLRPNTPIYVFTANRKTYNTLSLAWGIYAVYIEENDFDKILKEGIEILVKEGKLKRGDIALLAGGTTMEDNSSKNTLSTQTMGAVIKI